MKSKSQGKNNSQNAQKIIIQFGALLVIVIAIVVVFFIWPEQKTSQTTLGAHRRDLYDRDQRYS
jgi:hypothetical protein